MATIRRHRSQEHYRSPYVSYWSGFNAEGYISGGREGYISGGREGYISGGERATYQEGERATYQGGERATYQGGERATYQGGERATYQRGHIRREGGSLDTIIYHPPLESLELKMILCVMYAVLKI